MSTTPKITMMGLYNYNGHLFDDMQLPTEIDRELFVNSFLLNYGEYPVIYTNWDIMKFAIGVWSKKWYHSIERIIKTLTEEYDPLHNFDRHEIYTDVEGKTGTTTDSISENVDRSVNMNESTANDTKETNEVSAYNSSAYQPDSQTTGELKGSRSEDTDEESRRRANSNGTTAEDRNLKHEGHLFGNIGVTESTTMALHELSLRREQNIIDIVADMLFKEVCKYVL